MLVLKKFSIVTLQFFFCIHCFAQREQMNSLRKLLPSLNDSARIDCLNKLGELFKGPPDCFGDTRSKAQVDTAESFALVAFEESKKINYLHGMAAATSLKADLAFEKYENYPETEKLARKAVSLFNQTGNKAGLNRALWRLGLALHSQSDFGEAIANYDSCYHLSKATGDSMYVFYSIITTARAFIESGNYKKAFEKLPDLHQLLLGNNNSTWKAWELQLIGDLYLSIDDFNAGLHYYQLAFQLIKPDYKAFARAFAINKQFDSAKYYYKLAAVDTGNQRKLRFYLTSMGEYNFWLNEYQEALPFLVRSLDYNRQDNDVNQEMRVLIDLANTHLALQNNDDAYRYAKEALLLAKQKGARQIVMNCYGILYSVYNNWQQNDSALSYHLKHAAIKDTITSAQVAAKLVSYDFNQKIELLNKQKEVQQVQLQKQSIVKKFLILDMVALLLMGIIIVRSIVLKRRNEAQLRELVENELQIEKLENEKKRTILQQEATELEMQALRAQMNPHFIFNSLNSINRFILMNEKAQASDYLTKFSKLVRLILQNSQANLIPLESELESLELYLELESLRFENRFEYKIKMPGEIDISALKVPPLIIQPYVENAVWHGLMHKEEKGKLEIEILQENEYLIFKVTDDGIGRKKSESLSRHTFKTHKSMGLKITAERISILWDRHPDEKDFVTINDLVAPDGSGAGTEVIIKIPTIHD